MSADLLRDAAAKMRDEAAMVRRPYGRDERVAVAVADWLNMTAAQVANYGPNMDSPWTKPHEQMALAVANAYLGDQGVS